MSHEHAVFDAIAACQADAVAGILAKDGQAIHARGVNGITPLHLAAVRCDASIARLLLERGADVNARKDDHWTPLHHACQNGDTETVRVLLEHGADVNTRSKDGWTPLHTAAVGVSGATVSTLAREGEVTGRKFTALGWQEVVRLLISAGADVNAPKSGDGATPLILAVYKRQESVVRALLELGAVVKAASSVGWTALHIAAALGEEQLVRLLLEHHADVDAPGKDQRKPGEVIGMSNPNLDTATRRKLEELLRPSQAAVSTESGTQETIEIEAESLEEARGRVPAGYGLICEQIIWDGQQASLEAAAAALQTASQNVRKRVPAGAVILGEKVLAEPGEITLEVDAYTEAEAQDKARKSIREKDTVIEVKLQTLGRKGFLGIGRQPNRYNVGVAQVAHVEISFRPKARIRGRLLDLTAFSKFLDSITDQVKATAKSRAQLPQNWAGPEHMVTHVARMCFLGLDDHRKEFNRLLERAKVWWPQDQELRSVASLTLGAPVSPGPAELSTAYSECEAAFGRLHSLVSSHIRILGGTQTTH